jgi:hypothetical protein
MILDRFVGRGRVNYKLISIVLRNEINIRENKTFVYNRVILSAKKLINSLNLLDWIKILKSQKEKNVKENLEMEKKI